MKARWAKFCIAAAVLFFVSGCGASETGEDADYAALQAEHRVAVETARDCVVEAGFTPTEITEDPDGVGLNFGVTVAGDASDAEREQAPEILDSCQAASGMFELYAELFALQVPTGAEREALWDEYVVCLGDAGVTVSNLKLNMHPNELVDYLVNFSEGRINYETNEMPDPVVSDEMWACMEKYHYSVFPTNDF